jgi:HEAT repeat protein
MRSPIALALVSIALSVFGPPEAVAQTGAANPDAVHRALLRSLAGLAQESPQVRAEAARFAGALRHPLFVDPLRGLALAPEPEVRKAACTALGELGVPRTPRDLFALVETLERATKDPDDAVAETALDALGRFPFPEVRFGLARIARDSNMPSRRRQAATRALTRPISAEARQRLESWLSISTKDVDPSGGEAAPSFKERYGIEDDELLHAARDLLDPDIALHAHATWAIVKGERKQSLPFLRRALKERDPTIRRAVAMALASDSDDPSLLALVPAIRDQDIRVRSSAIAGLSKSKASEATRALTDRFRDEADVGLRKRIAAALAAAPESDLFASIAAWDPKAVRDDVQLELIPIAAAKPSTAAASALVGLIITAHREDVAEAALGALSSRDDRQVLPALLGGLDRSAGGTAARSRLVRALHGRKDPRITVAMDRLFEKGGGDSIALGILTAQPDARPVLLRLADNQSPPIRKLALNGLQSERGEDVVNVLAKMLKKYPEEDAAFTLLIEQDRALILEPLLDLLGSEAQARRREAILDALRGRMDTRIATPVTTAAIASPELAPIAIDVLRGQEEGSAVPALAQLADAKQLSERSRADALRAMAQFGSDEVTTLVRPLAKDDALEVRMAARNALHTLDPELYPKWDPYGRVPLVVEAAGFGAGMMLLASDIAQANLTPFFTGAVGMVLGGATPFLLTLNEDVTLGDAGFFGTVAAWGTLGGWGLGGSLELSDQNVRWVTLGGEILGLTVAGIEMKRAEWSLDDAALVNFSGLEAGILTGSLYALAQDLNGSADAKRAAYVGLLGGAVGTVPVAIMARHLRADGNVLPISTAMAYGAWFGAFAPGVVYDKGFDGTHALVGVVSGQALGYFAGLTLSQFGDVSPRSTAFSALGGAAGAAMLSGLALSIDGLDGRPTYGLLEAGTAAGALTLGLLAPKLEFHGNDPAIVALAAIGGAIAGGQFSIRAEEHTFGERSFPGGMLLGLGAGTFGGLLLSQIVDVSDKRLITTLVGGGVLGVAGTGLGYMMPNLSVRPRSSLSSAGILGGLALSYPFGDALNLDTIHLEYATMTGAALGFWSGFLPTYWHSGQDNDSAPASEIAGGVTFGSALGLAAGTALSQALTLDGHRLGVSTLGAVAGSSIGGGFGLLVPELDRHAAVALLQGTGLAGLAGFTLLSQRTTSADLGGQGGDDDTLAEHVAAFTLHGAFQGGVIPYVRRPSQPDPGEVAGGLLLGAGVGSIAGVLSLQLLDRPLAPPDLVEATMLAVAANGIGGGTGLLAQDQRLGAALMEGLGVSGYAVALVAAPHTHYELRDSATFAFTMSTLGWIGGWLPSTFSDAAPTSSQVGGGILAGASLGVLAGSLYTQLAAEREELEMTVMTAGAAGLGGGFGLVVGGASDRQTIALLEGTTALGLGASILLAPRTTYTEGDLAMIMLLSAAGAWHGAWSVPAVQSADASDRQRAGGLVFGSSLGLLGGMALSQLIDPATTDVIKTGLLASSLGAIGGGLVLSLPSSDVHDTARALELSGLGGLAAFSLIAPQMDFETRDSTLIALTAAAGAWHGALLPRLWSSSPTDTQQYGGALLGFGAGALSGAAIAQIGHLDYADQGEVLFYSLAGNAIGGGLGLLSPGVGNDTTTLLIDGAGLGALTLSLALSQFTTYSLNDDMLVGVGSAFGLWQGLWLPALFYDPKKPIADASTFGGALFGAGLGAIGSGILSQFVDLDAGEQLKASVPYLFASSLGAGVGLLVPSLDRRETVALMEGAGVAGLAAGLLLAKSTDYRGGDLGLLPVGAAVGGGVGLTLPTLLALDTSQKSQNTETVGGALLGAGVLGIGAATLAQVTDYQGDDIQEIAGMSVVGAGLGYGLGLMIPSSDRQLQFALLDGAALVSFASALAYAPVIDVKRDDSATLVLTGVTGGFMGGFAPVLWNSAGISAIPPQQVGGGILFGASAGLATGVLLSQTVTMNAERREYAALGGAMGALSGSGLGLLLSTDDRLSVGLLEGLTLAGSVGVALSGPEISFGGKDIALGTAYVGYLTWHTMGLTLLLQGTDRQAAGAAMATVGVGTLTGMYLARYIDLNLPKVLMLFAGNVWGTWIGGWGGAILRDQINQDLGARRSAGLTLVSTVLGSDVGLTVTGLVVGGLLDVKPTRFAVINLSGLGGMMIGMLAAGFAKEQPLKAGNVIGSLAGLVAGSIATSFINFDESPTWDQLLASSSDAQSVGAARADAAKSTSTSGLPFAVDTWFPSAHVAPGMTGEQQYLFSVMGTWH